MRCAYCFGPITSEPHTVRGRTYHPPVMAGGKAIPGSGCAAKDTAADPTPPKVHKGQTSLC